MPPHYNPISRPESDLAVGKFGLIMTINFLNRGVLSLLFIVAFLRTLDVVGAVRSQFRTSTYLIGVWAVGAVLIAFFPTEVPATPISWWGQFICCSHNCLHRRSLWNISTLLKTREKQEFASLKRIALPLSIIVVVFWIIEFSLPFIFPHLNAHVGGLTERLFLGSVLLWIVTTSAYLATNKLPTKVG